MHCGFNFNKNKNIQWCACYIMYYENWVALHGYEGCEELLAVLEEQLPVCAEMLYDVWSRGFEVAFCEM